MPTTPTLTLCDELVAHLEASWGPVAPSGAERCYFKRLGDGDDATTKLEGRRVLVMPTGYDNGPETRGEDGYLHRILALIVERYTDAGDPPTEWIDERVDFVFEQVVQGFDFGRSRPTWNPMLTTLSANVSIVDVEKLVTGGKLFYSLVDFEFAELINA